MKGSNHIFFIMFLVFFLSFQAHSQEEVFYAEEGKWFIYQIPEDEDPYCILYFEFSINGADSAIGMTFSEDLTTLTIYQGDWKLPLEEVYEVYLQFDSGENYFTSALVTSEDALTISEDLTSWLQTSDNPSFLYLHTPQTTLSYDVRGFDRASKIGEKCLREALNPLGNNPFLANQTNKNTNPFKSDNAERILTNKAINDFVIEPNVDFQTYEELFNLYGSEDIEVKVQPSTFYIGAYEALIADSIYNLYWEEDSSTRLTPRLFGDFVAKISNECEKMATSLVSEINFETHNFYRGSMVCSVKDDPTNSLYFRLSIYDLGTRAILFLTFSSAEYQELVDLLDDDLDLNDSFSEDLN